MMDNEVIKKTQQINGNQYWRQGRWGKGEKGIWMLFREGGIRNIMVMRFKRR
jgi:hypothetical protein